MSADGRVIDDWLFRLRQAAFMKKLIEGIFADDPIVHQMPSNGGQVAPAGSAGALAIGHHDQGVGTRMVKGRVGRFQSDFNELEPSKQRVELGVGDATRHRVTDLPVGFAREFDHGIP